MPLVLWGPGVTPGATSASGAPRRHRSRPSCSAARSSPCRRAPARSVPRCRRQLPAPPTPTSNRSPPLSTAAGHRCAASCAIGRKMIALPLPELYDLARDPREREQPVRRRPATPPGLLRSPARPSRPGRRPRGRSPRRRRRGCAASATRRHRPRRKAAYDRRGRSQEPGPARRQDPPGHRRLLAAPIRKGRGAGTRRWCSERPAMADGYEHLALALRQLERHDEGVAVLRDGLRRAGISNRCAASSASPSPRPATPPEAVEVLPPLAQSPAADSTTLNASASRSPMPGARRRRRRRCSAWSRFIRTTRRRTRTPASWPSAAAGSGGARRPAPRPRSQPQPADRLEHPRRGALSD